ncbi:haloacid dehalogenase [Pueribacillus theae]|uniref:Haloacid dehalogenase n=2 Tax=Pueribacillus theae TaxID=2171751 RepID=A0A2U1JU68_9BACI|nr:Cof-type HAD-IIB family hydrolase [Pueribacillus theae]PWA08525.1 haloacid dehalogenase [Pueribacillus theae]
MVYKLIALDVDGTILRSNHRIDKGVKEAIQYVKQKGVYVTLATRRHFTSAKKIAKALKLDSILITHNGAFLANDMDAPWLEKRISPSESAAIIHLLEQTECHVRIKHERFSVANRVRQNQGIIAKMTIGDPLFYPVNFTDELGSHLEESPVSPPQIEVFFSNKKEGDLMKEKLLSRFETIDVNMYEENRMEIVPKGVSKGNALRKLGERLGFSNEEMVAVGDSHADISMIRDAGLGVAMGNAPKSVQAYADWITRSNDMNGVYYVVKEVFRKQLRTQIRTTL